MNETPIHSSPIALDLHADLYRPEAVERALQVLNSIGTFTVERCGSYLRVHITPVGDPDPAVLKGHLANWALVSNSG